MQDRSGEVADVAAQIETLLQKWERKQLATSVRRTTDQGSLDYPAADRAYRAKRTILTAAIFELAETIVNGVKSND